jgi:2-iminoacetate synthase ThiH
VRELVMTHADRVRISPVHGCSYHCSFCTCNAAYYKEISCEQLDQAFQIALNDPYNQPRHVLISGGTPNEDAESYTWLNDIYRYFPRKYPQYDFDVMLSPRGMKPGQTSAADYAEFLRYLHDECGIKTLSINLELYNDQYRERFIPNKASVGKEHYCWFIRQAVAIFGMKNVRSSLVVGLEPAEDTLNGVRTILDCGCLPVLSAFVPAPGTDMANYPAPDAAFLLDVVRKADEMARATELQLGPLCRPCTHNSITVEDGEIGL